jgi:hypothetical protein
LKYKGLVKLALGKILIFSACMNGKRPPRHKQLVVGDCFKPSSRTASQKAAEDQRAGDMQRVEEDRAAKLLAERDAVAAAARQRPPNGPRLTSAISRGGLWGGVAM